MGNKRVVCLGDSITEGVGVNIGERYVDYLCELLNLFPTKIKSRTR